MPAIRTGFFAGLVSAAILVFTNAHDAIADDAKLVEIWKDPSCGCCAAWANHLQAAGFEVQISNTDHLNDIKRMNRIPPKLASCHTAKVGGYVIEGHVPASDIMKLITEKPKILGLAVPGMPLGSPGMEVPSGEKDAYDVISFDERGNAAVYSSHE